MEGDALRLQPIPVTTTIGRPVGARQVHRPTTVLHGDRLQRGMGSSVPATLEGVPGVHSSFNGPGAASPVIRGLPGDRVLMLEDGHRTGDIYWTAADHGVMAEPLTSERIEVVRGPAGLLYGANALGGVVNVIRDDIPTRTLDAWSTMLALQGESVSDGVAGAVVSRGAAGPLDLHVEGAARRSGDMRTPAGRLEDTDMRVLSGALGASVAPSWGRAGVSVRGYGSRYGVPGEFDGVLIPGGHPGGVSIEVDRLAVRGLVDVAVGSPAIEQVEVRGSGTLFDQREIEGTLVGEDVIGARFEQISGDVRVLARHSALAVADGLTGAFGMALQGRFLEAGGASPGTRSGRELDLGVFAYEELRLEPFRVQLAARHDLRAVTTDDLSDIRVRTEERRIVKPVASRMFHAPSLSLSGLWDLADHWTLGLGLSRAARPPTIEELYSDGPHLADFSFDIGSPELGVETGHGVDLFLRSDHRRVELEVAGYVNHMRRFIQYAPTGETVFVFREGVEPRETPVYEARGEDALFVGAEASLDLTLVDRWVVELSGSWVRASRVDDGDPLPWIPPLNGRLGLRFDGRILFGSAGVRAAATQSRVPRPVAIGESTARPVEPTDGHVLADLSVGWHLITPHYDHTLMLQVLNVADTAWRDHLSRIKDVAPQPGRNVQLTWRAWF
ncbi:MAG: TonB-dependent receptor [Deltaproteobacteria bacterium]|nr:MAG: TonB-dependent receptor [Deltaproteobacteria bacterium]